MNRVYRLVWNRSRAVMQVASELASAHGASSSTSATRAPRRHPLALAMAALSLACLSAPAWSQTCTPTDPSGCAASGGVGERPTRSPDGGTGNGTGGDATIWITNTSEGPGSTATGGVGGSGSNGVFNPDGSINVTATGGAGGGVGATNNVGSSVTGGVGGAGQAAASANAQSLVGGGGGGGGAGVYLSQASAIQNVAFITTITGGAGGKGGDALASAANGYANNGDPGGGGGGGAGAIIGTGGAGTILAINGIVLGGAGGAGGNGGYAGGGGGGGDGLLVLGAGVQVGVNGSGVITGGSGGNAGTFQDGSGERGGYGGGGAGVNLVGAGASLTNMGSITGGGAGVTGRVGGSPQDGSPGVGVRAWGGETVTNWGSIAGGSNSNVQADSVLFSGGGNQLMIEAGAIFTGNIDSISGTTNGGDTLTLGGNTNGILNAGLIVGFANNIKAGNSSWTLTGLGNPGIDWTIQQGELIGNASTFVGNLSFVAPLPGGTSPTVDFNQTSNGSYAGTISGTGGLIKDGAGTLSFAAGSDLSGFTGALTINSGGVALTNDGDLHGVTIAGNSAYSVDFSNITASTAQIAGLSSSDSTSSVLLGAHTLTIGNPAGSAFAGIISGTGGLALDSGTQTLSGANLYSGTTTLNGGTLAFSGGGQISASSVQINSGTLDASAKGSGNSLQMVSLAGSGSVNLGSAGITLSNAGGTYGGVIGDTVSGSSAGGTVTIAGGAELFNGINTYTGLTSVASGATLFVGDSAHSTAAVAGDVSVDAGTFGGYGVVRGSVVLSNGATLVPGAASQVGSLTIQGDLTVGAGSQLKFDFGAPGPNFSTPGQSDHVVVNGNLSIDTSTLNVNNLGSMGPGLYNLFTWGNTLDITGGGFAPPAGMSLQILTVDRQINLIDTQNLTLSEWDANGLAGPGSMGGGSGTWSLFSNSWSDTTGQFVGPMTPQPGFAIFGGASGTVTVDDSNGNVGVTGMQFVSDGYHLTGDAINLVGQSGAAPVLRVSSGDTAIIDNVLDGVDGLNKTDGGTLVLNGSNIYTGTTTLSGGYLSVSSDANLGAASNPLDFEGGTLKITGTGFQQTSRNIVWGSAGGGFDIDDANNTFTVTQALTGTGGLLKSGAGTLVLSGANTYAGGTVIGAGTLQGDSTSLQGNITNNATLAFAQNADGTFVGAISGSGGLIKNGAGTLTLSGVNSYGGGTIVNAGTLQGDSNSLQGNIDNHATVAFAQNTDGTFAGAVSGTGQLIKTGSGTLTLTGANSYAGGTTINAGTLRGDTTSLQGAIVNNASLDFAQATDGSFAGVISGTGQLIKDGAGTLVLAAASTYSGGTIVNAGNLQGDASTLRGSIVDNGTVTFAQAADATFAGTLSGNGQLVKNGSGTLVFDDANAFGGSTEVAAGKLVVGDDTHAGASLGGTVTVDSGATLGGIGSIGGLDLSGTLTPGNSIGTLTVQGDATFRAGSSYQVEVAPDGSSDRIAVSGHASLLGGSALALGSNGNWAPQTSFQIITATGGVSGQFDSISSNLAFLTPALSYGANAVTLQLSRNDIHFSDVAQTRNQRAVAAAIEPLGMTSPLYQGIVGLDADTARRDFDSLSGESIASTRTALIDDSRYVRDAIDRHLLGLHQDGAQATDAQGVTAWTSAWGHWGDQDGDDNAARMQANGSGLLVGADMGVGGDARVGVVVGHRQASMRVDDRNADAHASTTDLALYGDDTFGAFALRGGLAYAWQQIDGSRVALFGNASERLDDSYDARVAHGFVEGSYRFQLSDGQQWEPFLNLARVQLHTGGTRENGGVAALSVAGSSTAVNFATLGLRDTWSMSAAGGMYAHVGIGWQQAWGDVTPMAAVRLASGSNSFDIAGTPVARHAGVIDAGLSFALSRRVSFDASYGGRFGDGATDQSARMSLTVVW
jgi:fibronectin-binding autotransporter adhesin